MRDFLQMHIQEPVFFWFTSDVFLKRPVSFKYWLLHPFFYKEATSKSSTKKELLSAPEESGKEHVKCLSLDTPLWWDGMSTNKGTLSDQPWLTHIMPTALLGSWVQQPIKDMTSLGTDFEMHANWQGNVKEPTAKNFVAKKAHTIAFKEPSGTWSSANTLGNFPEAVIGRATINLIHKFGNPLRIPYPSSTALLSGAYVMQES